MKKRPSSTMIGNTKELFPELVPSEVEHKEGKDFPYRSLIARLLFLSTHTQLDIKLSVGFSSRLVKSPTTLP